jgi:hypothetical protein
LISYREFSGSKDPLFLVFNVYQPEDCLSQRRSRVADILSVHYTGITYDRDGWLNDERDGLQSDDRIGLQSDDRDGLRSDDRDGLRSDGRDCLAMIEMGG